MPIPAMTVLPALRRPIRPIALAAALVLAASSLPRQAGAEPLAATPPESQQRQVQPSASLAQRLRRLLNLSPPLAVGGSRSGAGLRVCLLSPWPTTAPTGEALAVALVPTATPTLLASAALNEIQILRNGRIAWQQRASSSEAISGAIAWPIEPLMPGEQVVLRLRPRGASGGDFAAITLQAADAATLQRVQSLVAALQTRPDGWQAAIEREAGANPAVAVALAGDPSAPADARQALAAAGGCQFDARSSRPAPP